MAALAALPARPLHAQAADRQRAPLAAAGPDAPPVAPTDAVVEATEATTEATTELTAEALFREGLSLVREGRLAQAVVRFQQSTALVPRPSAHYNLALALYRLGRYRESLLAVQVLLDGEGAPDFEPFLARGRTLRDRADAQLARLVLHVHPAEAALQVDGHPHGDVGPERVLRLDPGAHRLVLSREAHATRELSVLLEPGGSRELTVVLAAEAVVALPADGRDVVETDTAGTVPTAVSTAATTTPPSALPQAAHPGSDPANLRVASYWLMGAGATLLGAALVTGIFALRSDQDFAEACPDLQGCDPDLRTQGDTVETLGLVTDVLWIGGAAVAGTGLSLWLWPGDDELRPAVGLTSVSLRGRF